MFDICCIGHITLDKVVTPRAVMHMAGGTAFYFSYAIRNICANYALVTAVADTEMQSVDQLRENGVKVKSLPSAHTVYFENIYGDNQDNRTQRVLQKADAFNAAQLQDVNSLIFHLGPLLADDISADMIKALSYKGKISLDAQGFLRKVVDKEVQATDWPEKQQALKYVKVLKVNEHEMEALTSVTDIRDGAKVLAGWGVKEVVVTLGSLGSVIYAYGSFYEVPAYKPADVVDATGCGDTYMAGYLARRIKGDSVQQAGNFASAMAALKIEQAGPFKGTEADVLAMMER
jgi:sugar/nucleoside kinase (ribokinase family)